MNAAIACARSAARAYVQHAPWRFGKRHIWRLYDKHIGWRSHREIVYTRFGDQMEIELPDLISRRIDLTGEWEPVITRYVISVLKPGDIFIDVGANVGYYTLIASRLVGPSGHVHAIEASRRNFSRLKRNLDLNGCRNVRAVNAAAASEKGELTVYLGGPQNWGHSTTVPLYRKGTTEVEDRIPADVLDVLVPEITSATIVKIDVDGAEIDVLSPIFPKIRDIKADWLVEFSPLYTPNGQDHADRIFSAFIAAGYQAYRLWNEYEPSAVAHAPSNVTLTHLNAAPTSGVSDVLFSRS